MRRGSFQAVSPAGLVIEAVTTEPDRLLIIARPTALDAPCPECGRRSGRVHSRYNRYLMDLPSLGRAVHLRVQVRRFRCGTMTCPRRIFGEPLADSVAPRGARRTARLEGIVHHLGIALGGRPAANLARRLMLPVSRDTLLRVLRRRAQGPGGPVRVIGIDDFAWKRGQRYGTVVCDLERRRIIDLLPDREPATVEAWLAAHREIAVVPRDRGAGYGRAASRGAPQAIQVADRWHLMENASAAFVDAVRRSMRAIRQVLGSTVIDPALLTSASSTTVSSGGRTAARRSRRWQRRGSRSRRSPVAPAAAASWSAACCAAVMATCPVAAPGCWNRTRQCSGPNGRRAAAMGPSCGAARATAVSEAAFGWSRSGPPGRGAARSQGWSSPARRRLHACRAAS
jgi:transposase